ncbi:flagellar filament capping protein FliD [Glaciihabitans sp. dw_435]|uniref:flagellar filament capping protein FliD n=1 Tax=Glaciihabitans sp. dw_435 TaxID=2720081 RepID=UPI001BD1D166|nr:flagellar filament capping protein FliD [Glaciihabitans sp. dw_435]
MGISLDGIASGLDTAALISQLMALEAVPQNLLKNQVTATQTKLTDLQSLNTKVASLGEAATAAALPTALKTFSAISSAANVTVSSTTAERAGSLDITVTQLAQAQTQVTAPLTAWPTTPPVVTVVGSDGTAHEITAASADLNDVVSAINAAGAGITATKVASGVDASGTVQYRLQLVSATTGQAGAFSIYRGSSAEVTAGTAVDLGTETGAAKIRAAQDATITLWAGTGAEQSISSTSNTFTAVLPGVDVTVNKVSTDPATVTVARDVTKATAAVRIVINAIATTLALIDQKSATETTQDDTGKDVTALGSFTSDRAIRDVRSSIQTAMSAPVDGRSPSEIGISFDKTGNVVFDEEKFQKAMADDPDRTEAVYAAITTRLAAAAATASDKTTGTITTKITGSEAQVKDYTSQVEAWDRRLTTREATLKATYAALEVSMSKLNSQSAYLTSQLASLAAQTSSS